jgi:oligopeptide transport system substrate-binding protein
VANPYYVGGPLHVRGIDMPFMPEPLAAYKRYRAGAVDIMGAIHFPAQALYDVEGQPEFHSSARLETVYLTLNTRRAPLNDARVRLALAHAIDRDALVREVYGNFARPAQGMLPPGIRGYNPHLHAPGYDPTLARHLLAAAGYPGGRGLPPITYAVDQDAQSMLLASTVVAQWRSVLGVQVHLAQHDHNTYLDLLTRHAYDVAVIDWTVDYPDPQNFLSQLLHSNVPNNNGAWHNATFDRLVDAADAMKGDAPVRMALYRRAEDLAMNQAAAIPLVNPLSGILLRSRIHGLQINGGQVLAADWAWVIVYQSSSS